MQKLPSPDSDNCLPHRSRVASETEGGACPSLAVCCGGCLEENKVCKCGAIHGGGGGIVEDKAFGNTVNANSSFVHAVINMSGMLIGKSFKPSFFFSFKFLFAG